jgi:hypothetical protein
MQPDESIYNAEGQSKSDKNKHLFVAFVFVKIFSYKNRTADSYDTVSHGCNGLLIY